MTLKIGTRGSKLATTQAGTIRDQLKHYGRDAELHIVTTPGDVNMSPVERIGVGVFTQALRDVLHSGECDVAVHSMKDLPTATDPRFHLVVPTRADSREALIARDGLTLAELPEGARWELPLLDASPSSRQSALTWRFSHCAETLTPAWARSPPVNSML